MRASTQLCSQSPGVVIFAWRKRGLAVGAILMIGFLTGITAPPAIAGEEVSIEDRMAGIRFPSD